MVIKSQMRCLSQYCALSILKSVKYTNSNIDMLPLPPSPFNYQEEEDEAAPSAPKNQKNRKIHIEPVVLQKQGKTSEKKTSETTCKKSSPDNFVK